MLDAMIASRDRQHEEGRKRNGEQGHGSSRKSICQIAQTEHPQPVGAGTDLPDSDRLAEFRLVGPTIADQVLMQARQIAESSPREERSLDEEQKIDKRSNH